MFNLLVERKNEVFESEKLVSVSNPLWSDLAKKLNYKINPNSIYLMLYNNRHSWQTKLKDIVGIKQCSEEYDGKLNENDYSSSSSTSSFSFPKSERELFEFDLSYDAYRSILPTVVDYKRKSSSRQYNILKPNAWIDVFNDTFITKFKLPCNFIYKRAKVCINPSQCEKYIRFEGKCKEESCNALLTGWCKDKPNEGEPLRISILTKNTIGQENKHTGKRPLKGEKRKAIGIELSKDLACNWRRKHVENLEFGRLSPPNLYRNEVLRKTKQEHRDRELGITKKNAIESLVEFKHNSSYSGSIHTIGMDPFVVHYWSGHQITIYKDVSKQYCKLSIDATGGLVKKIKRTSLNLTSAYIFLYEVVVSTNFGHISVTNMLSERQDTLTILNWLAQWKNCIVYGPNEIVCDYSMALLGALTRAFCDGWSLRKYTNKCFLLLNDKTREVPKCYIRLDVAHMIKIFCRFKCLLIKKDKSLKEFYVRGMRLLLTSDTLTQFEEILQDLFNVMMCETDGWIDDNNTLKTPSEISKDKLLVLMRAQKRDCVTTDEDTMKCINNSFNDNADEVFETKDDDDIYTSPNSSIGPIDAFLNNIKEKKSTQFFYYR